MSDQSREHELEFLRDADPDDMTDDQKQMMRVANIAVSFDTERGEAVQDRRTSGIDERLITSYQLYEGQRDSQGQESFDATVSQPVSGSRAYANITRQIANDGAAQIGDLLFPNDDRNYGFKPVRLAKPPLAVEDEPAVDSKGNPVVEQGAEGETQLTNKQAHMRRVERSKKRSDRMFAKTDAALIKARYPSKARQVISAGSIYGTGVLKGPIPTKDRKGRWSRKKDGKYGLNKDVPLRPDAKVINPMDFYPDMSATCVEECRYIWERMGLQPVDLERAVAELGYKPDAVSRLLASGASVHNRDVDDTVDEARPATSANGRHQGRYIVWERHGSMSREELTDLGVKVEGSGKYHNAILTLCDGEILKAVKVPYESDDALYSVYCWDEDPLSIFGYGIPWLMQDQQRSYVSAWRMALDNGGLSAAPQILIDRQAVTPANGKWELHGGKEWYLTGQQYSNEGSKHPFQAVEITENLEFIFVMMDRSIQDAYELTGVTRVDNAQQGLDNAPVTLGATQIVQNNTSVSRRAQARRWDDNVTLGFITRVYDYFMQFEDDDDIKANMEVEPRGATVLLAKELTATNTIQLYQMTGNGEAPGAKGVEILRGIETAMQIPAGSYIETEDETEARVAAEQEQGAQADPMYLLEERKVEVEEAEVELAQMDRQLDVLKANQTHEINTLRLQLEEAKAMADIDANSQARIDQFHSDMEKAREKHAGEMQKFMQDNQTKRDLTAAKINADGGVKSREHSIKEREVANKEREMSYKERTGGQGI